jgi:hypothetical protein
MMRQHSNRQIGQRIAELTSNQIDTTVQERTTGVEEPTRRSRELQRRVTTQEREELIAGYSAGAGVVQLAQHFNLHRATVRKILKRHGIEPRPLGLTDPQVREGALLYADGQSLAQLGERFDVDPSTVWRALRAAGVKLRPPTARSRPSIPQPNP